MLEVIGDKWEDFLSAPICKEEVAEMRSHENTDRPLGSESSVESLENILGYIMKPKKVERKPKKVQNRYGVPGSKN